MYNSGFFVASEFVFHGFLSGEIFIYPSPEVNKEPTRVSLKVSGWS